MGVCTMNLLQYITQMYVKNRYMYTLYHFEKVKKVSIHLYVQIRFKFGLFKT